MPLLEHLLYLKFTSAAPLSSSHGATIGCFCPHLLVSAVVNVSAVVVLLLQAEPPEEDGQLCYHAPQIFNQNSLYQYHFLHRNGFWSIFVSWCEEVLHMSKSKRCDSLV